MVGGNDQLGTKDLLEAITLAAPRLFTERSHTIKEPFEYDADLEPLSLTTDTRRARAAEFSSSPSKEEDHSNASSSSDGQTTKKRKKEPEETKVDLRRPYSVPSDSSSGEGVHEQISDLYFRTWISGEREEGPTQLRVHVELPNGKTFCLIMAPGKISCIPAVSPENATVRWTPPCVIRFDSTRVLGVIVNEPLGYYLTLEYVPSTQNLGYQKFKLTNSVNAHLRGDVLFLKGYSLHHLPPYS